MTTSLADARAGSISKSARIDPVKRAKPGAFIDEAWSVCGVDVVVSLELSEVKAKRGPFVRESVSAFINFAILAQTPADYYGPINRFLNFPVEAKSDRVPA